MSENILVVDDSPTVRNIIKIYLMNLRLSILEAEDATRALQLLRLVPVSVVIAELSVRPPSATTMSAFRTAIPWLILQASLQAPCLVSLSSDSEKSGRWCRNCLLRRCA